MTSSLRGASTACAPWPHAWHTQASVPGLAPAHERAACSWKEGPQGHGAHRCMKHLLAARAARSSYEPRFHEKSVLSLMASPLMFTPTWQLGARAGLLARQEQGKDKAGTTHTHTHKVRTRRTSTLAQAARACRALHSRGQGQCCTPHLLGPLRLQHHAQAARQLLRWNAGDVEQKAAGAALEGAQVLRAGAA